MNQKKLTVRDLRKARRSRQDMLAVKRAFGLSEEVILYLTKQQKLKDLREPRRCPHCHGVLKFPVELPNMDEEVPIPILP